jgi:hypothetical protein
MIKRVNFTGRRRIPRDRVDITVYDGQPRTFDALIALDGLSFLPHAAVYLEATCAGSTVIKRFPFGEVGTIEPPQDRALVDLDSENVFFTLKVIDRTERFGRILGVAEYIRPRQAGKQTVAGRRGILPLEPADLGQQLWRLDYQGHDVHLFVNKNVPGLIDRVRSDPLFYAAVYPAVVRQVLTSAIEEDVEIDEESDRWPVLWLRFGKELHPAKENPPKPGDPKEERDAWIDDIVDAFCNDHALKDKYLSAMGGNGGEL